MFDKIPSLKDFILYVIPVVLICYFGLNIWNSFQLVKFDTKDDINFSFIAIIFSFFIGFIFSQAQILMFNKFLKEKLRKMRTIKETQSKNIELKEVLIKRIKIIFEIEGKNIEDDNLIVFNCLNYIKINANSESQIFIDRCNNLSSFAMTLPFPLILALCNLIIKTEMHIWASILISVLTIIILVAFVMKVIINFRDDYYKNIFRQFLVLTTPNN